MNGKLNLVKGFWVGMATMMLACGSALAGNIVVNGSFEAGTAGWTAIFNSYGVYNGFAAKDGTWFLHAGNSFSDGGRYQDLPTVPGKAYKLEFWCVGFNSGAAVQRGKVQVGTPGPNAGDLLLENNAEYVNQTVDVPKFMTTNDWTKFSYVFTPTSTTTRLTFENVKLEANQNAVNIDLVSVTPPNGLPPLDSAVALWTFSDRFDLNGGQSDFVLSSNFTVGNATSGLSPYLLNSDGYAAREGADPSYGYIWPLPAGHELRAAAGGPVTLFVRTRRAAFAGNDSLVYVGMYNNPSWVSYSMQLVNGNPVFCAWGTNETASTLQYLGSTLATNVWYDLTGVFDPGQPGVADGKVTLYVFDLAARRYVGIQETNGLPFEALRDDWASMSLLFLEAPNNSYGNDNGAELELAAVWNRALSADEVKQLSAEKKRGTMIAIF